MWTVLWHHMIWCTLPVLAWHLWFVLQSPWYSGHDGQTFPLEVLIFWPILVQCYRLLHQHWKLLVLMVCLAYGVLATHKILMVLLLWDIIFYIFFIKSTFSLYVLADADQFVFLLLVGSSEIFLYVLVFSNSSAFLWHSALSIITKETPLSAVNMTLLLSSFSSLRTWYSFLDMFNGDLEEPCAFFRVFFTSTLISSASTLFNLEQACSTATTYSWLVAAC